MGHSWFSVRSKSKVFPKSLKAKKYNLKYFSRAFSLGVFLKLFFVDRNVFVCRSRPATDRNRPPVRSQKTEVSQHEDRNSHGGWRLGLQTRAYFKAYSRFFENLIKDHVHLYISKLEILTYRNLLWIIYIGNCSQGGDRRAQGPWSQRHHRDGEGAGSATFFCGETHENPGKACFFVVKFHWKPREFSSKKKEH